MRNEPVEVVLSAEEKLSDPLAARFRNGDRLVERTVVLPVPTTESMSKPAVKPLRSARLNKLLSAVCVVPRARIPKSIVRLSISLPAANEGCAWDKTVVETV